ncbi:BnaA06g38780D [Brassica napus]|uniref:BnaA06g38780D protein n=1 Tax=Brassica napus TaxID=3708 RepID=A0A078IV73_BRANA|nr:BnaA06g38780D [Brassica napus]
MIIPDDHHHLSFPSYVLHQEHITPNPNPNPNPTASNSNKRKRNLPGNPGMYNPDAEVIALSPNSLMTTNRFICEICNKGFKRDQNLQLHRRGHNLPWKLKQRTDKEQVKKKVYICPEKTCVHHDPGRALGDLTGIKKHFSRKHGEKKWKCDKCSKKYAVVSDWKAHSKICGTREYKCDCGTLFSRKDSFITHRAFCDALAEESARFASVPPAAAAYLNNSSDAEVNLGNIKPNHQQRLLDLTSSQLDRHGFNVNRNNINGFMGQSSTNQLPLAANVFASSSSPSPHSASALLQNLWQLQGQSYQQWLLNKNNNNIIQSGMPNNQEDHDTIRRELVINGSSFSSEARTSYNQNGGQEIASMSATTLLQMAAQIGSKRSSSSSNNGMAFGLVTSSIFNNKEMENKIKTKEFDERGFTRDFLGVGSQNRHRPILMVNHNLPTTNDGTPTTYMNHKT